MMDKQSKPSLLKHALLPAFARQIQESRNMAAAQVIAAMPGLSAPIVGGAATGHHDRLDASANQGSGRASKKVIPFPAFLRAAALSHRQCGCIP
jgi:hypothetical protein